MNHRHLLLSTIAVAALPGIASAQTAPAQDAPAAAAPEAPPTDIVVTGRAGGNGIRKLEAGYSITTMSSNDIAIQNPKSAGDLLKSVPGVWVESSGGVGTTNVMVRGIPTTGDAPFLTMQFDGIPVFGTYSPSFMDQTALVRIDETVQGMESVNGGPAALFSDGQPGLTTNLILREGHDRTEGDLKLSATNYGARRIDGYLSGKLAEDTYYMVGGYYQSGDTVRKAGFDTEKGGQITANITHKFDNGKLNIFARYTDDHGEWFTPFASGVPGVNQGTYNQLNNYTRYLTIVTPGSGGASTEQFDFGKGRGWKGVVGGGNLSLSLSDHLDFSDKFGFTSGTLQTVGLVPQGAGAITVATALADGDGTAGQTTVTGIHTGQVLSGNDYVQQVGAWVVEKQLSSISNEAGLTYNIDGHKITAGYYFTHFSSNDLWSVGNNYWMQIGGAADLVDLNNGTLSSYAIADFGSSDENAFYLADSWQITDLLRLDAGLRYEVANIKFAMVNTGGADGALDINRHALPWSVGLDYKAMPTLNFYARASEGYHLPSFDDVRSQIGTTSGPALDDNWKVLSFEVGVKYHEHGLDLSLSGFYDKVTGEVYNDVGVVPTVAGSKTWGLEFAGSWTSSFGFSVNTDATWEDPKTWAPGQSVTDSLTGALIPIDGLQAARIPKYQARITPQYKYMFGTTAATLYATFEALGKRFSDLADSQPLAAYQTLSGGILVERGGATFQAAVDNLTNSHGLTEGNPRYISSATAAIPDVRPIFGRSFRFTVGYKF